MTDFTLRLMDLVFLLKRCLRFVPVTNVRCTRFRVRTVRG